MCCSYEHSVQQKFFWPNVRSVASLWPISTDLLNQNASCVCVCVYIYIYTYIHIHIHRMSQEECDRLRESVPYVKVYRYNPKHLYPKLNGYEDNGQRKVRFHVLHLFS